MISAPANVSCTAEANVSENYKNGGLDKDMEKDKAKCLAGFIFLCNQSTKLECYRYRVFGLPLGAKEVVKEIKSGFKLFLFDFESKILYGVYEATSDGIINLEPAAFGGKFPAQVKFKIFKECLPMPESSLRFVIKENYTGSKFKQELSANQVKKLISSFRPLETSLHQPASQDLANVLRPGAMPPALLQNCLEPTGRLPVREVRYSGDIQYSHVEAGPVLKDYYPEHGSHTRAAYVQDVPPTSSYLSLPVANSYVAPQQPLRIEDVSNRVHDPSYSRYMTSESGSYHDRVTSFERRFYQLPLQREAPYQDNVASYYSNSTATHQYTPSVLQTQPPYASYQQLPLQSKQYQTNIAAQSSNPADPVQYTTSNYSQQGEAAYLPLQNEASHQGNTTANNSNLMEIAQYASTVLQRLEPVRYNQSSLHGTQYQDSAVAYSSNLAAVAQYPTSISQPQVEATYIPPQREAFYQDNVVSYNSQPTFSAQYTPMPQQIVPSTNWSVQSEALPRVNVAAYNYNLMVTAQYTPLGQPEGPSYAISDGRAPVASYLPYPAADHPSH